MDRTEKILLHIPIIGLLLMLVYMGERHTATDSPTYEETKLPIKIQIITILMIMIVAFIFN